MLRLNIRKGKNKKYMGDRRFGERGDGGCGERGDRRFVALPPLLLLLLLLVVQGWSH